MIRNDRIFGVRTRGLLVGMGMTARVKVTTTSASTGISQLRILTRVMLQEKQKQSMSMNLARLPPTTGRVYAMTRGQVAKTSGTITGILCIDDRTVFALFDTRATYSVISTTFAKKLNMTPTRLIERIIISTPMKNHTLIDHEYVNCP
nr:reverse transcriptase domain-containing protein [Tanacetum cinerariifolium]